MSHLEGKKPKTKIHKPGGSKSIAANGGSYAQQRLTTFPVLSSKQLQSLDALSFHLKPRASEPDLKDIPSYNLFNSRLNRRASLPNSLNAASPQRSITSSVFVPTVFASERKVLRKYTTMLGNTSDDNENSIEQTLATNDKSGHFKNSIITVLPQDKEPIKQPPSYECEPVSRHSARSHCDSISTIRCMTEVPFERRKGLVERRGSEGFYYSRRDSVKKWLDGVE